MYAIKKNTFNKLMFKKKLNRDKVAKGAGISIDTINSWLYRNTFATLETATKVFYFLEVSIEDLFDEC